MNRRQCRTRIAPSACGSSSGVQPVAARHASVSRSITSSVRPNSSATRERNCTPFCAARHASVAMRRARVTPLFFILFRQMAKAAIARAIAASLKRPDDETPSPSRTMRENASTTRKPSPDGRATSNRQLFVPRSSAAYVAPPRSLPKPASDRSGDRRPHLDRDSGARLIAGSRPGMSPASPLMLSKPSYRPARRHARRVAVVAMFCRSRKVYQCLRLTQPSVPKAILVEADRLL